MYRMVLLALSTALLIPVPAASVLAGAASDRENSIEVEAPAEGQPEGENGYRPPWADPYAKPPMPGIENDPTPFNPADVDSNADPLSNGP